MKRFPYRGLIGIKKPVGAWLAFFSILAFGMVGCASLSPEQCKNAEWRQIGFADGSNGAPGARIDQHAKACAEHNVRPNLTEYLSGRSQGLLSYCQAENGFALGRRGSDQNAGDCPENLKPAFLKQYQRGSQIHSMEQEIRNYRYRIDRNQTQVRRDSERMAKIKTELLKDGLASDRRAMLLNEFDQLAQRKAGFAQNNQFLQREIDRLQIRMRLKLQEFGR